MELFGILATLIAGALALIWARLYRDRQDADYTDPTGGTSLGTGPPRTSAAPFHRFPRVVSSLPFDVTRTRDGGFDVTCFVLPTGRNHRVDRACALVELPVDPPRFEMAEGGTMPDGVGPAVAEELEYLSGVRVKTAFHALLAQSMVPHAPLVQDTVRRTALRLARAIVRDAGNAPAATR